MTVRITHKPDCHRTVLQVDGRLSSADVDELTREFADAQPPIVLELSELRSVDSGGAEALLDLVAQGAALQGVTPYVELLLKSHQVASGRTSGALGIHAGGLPARFFIS